MHPMTKTDVLKLIESEGLPQAIEWVGHPTLRGN